MSMDAAFQNDVSTKLAATEQRINMSQAASTKIMREEFERLQTKLHAKINQVEQKTASDYKELKTSTDRVQTEVTYVQNAVVSLTASMNEGKAFNCAMYSEMKSQGAKFDSFGDLLQILLQRLPPPNQNMQQNTVSQQIQQASQQLHQEHIQPSSTNHQSQQQAPQQSEMLQAMQRVDSPTQFSPPEDTVMGGMSTGKKKTI